MVSGIPELTKELLDIINDDKRRAKMGAASLQVIKENRGAAVRSIEYLEDLLRITTVPATIMSRYPTNIRNLNDEAASACAMLIILFSMCTRWCTARKRLLWAACF